MNIVCITGTRADYGIYRPLLFELHKDEAFHVQLIVTGMHLIGEYGRTIDDIRRDPFPLLATPSILFKGDTTYAMSQSVGMAVLYFADLFQQADPDAILILGDRGEMLAAAIAAHYQNINVVHLHGGEQSGSADDAIRHAISRLAQRHFVSSARSKTYLLQMGIPSSDITVVGSLRKHDIQRVKTIDKRRQHRWKEKYALTSAHKNVLLVMHPDSKESLSFARQIDAVKLALLPIDHIRLIILGTNSDAGGDTFRHTLLQMAAEKQKWTYFPVVPPLEYLFLLAQVDLLIGNSSSGIIEAPFFHLPFINIGQRQKNREQGDNVYNVPYQSATIRQTVQKVLQQPHPQECHNPYDVLESPATTIVQQLKTDLK